MARRIRSIKPEILDDEKTASLSHLEWRLFVSLWLLADNYGNLRGQSVQIKGAALWATQDTPKEVGAAIDNLVSAGLVHRYDVAGQRYLHIPGWAKHQLVKSPGKPLVPGPECCDGSDSCDVLRKYSGERPETLPLDLDHDQRPTTSDRDQTSRARRAKAKHTLPDDWQPNESHLSRARTAGLDVNREAEKFRNHAAQNDRKCADWDAAFRNWLIGAEERKPAQRTHGAVKAGLDTQDILALADDLERRGM